MRVPARQAGGHVDLVRVHSEMDEGPFLELKNQVRRIAVVLVLADRVPPGLAGHRILELGRGDRDAVECQGDVQGISLAVRVTELARDGQPVGGVDRCVSGFMPLAGAK